MMELCDHGKIEWCPKCEEDLRKASDEKVETLLALLAECEEMVDSIRYSAEPILTALAEALQGLRFDGSWMNPEKLGEEERKQLFDGVEKKMQEILREINQLLPRIRQARGK